jgi:gluconolactonase
LEEWKIGSSPSIQYSIIPSIQYQNHSKQNKMKYLPLFALALLLAACNQGGQQQAEETPAETSKYPTLGQIDLYDARLLQVLDTAAVIEVLGEGFDWSEGPVWVPAIQSLLFNDIPPNKLMQWKEGEGVTTYLTPAGYTGHIEREGEPGANGLFLDPQGRLVLCQHGDRRIARLDAPLDQPEPKFVTVVDNYQGKRLNSPNDLAYDSKGNLYFTDPPYGLQQGMEDPAKEIPFQGVYRLDTAGNLTLLTDKMTRPNGIELSPDEKTLYVANSDPEKAVWMAYGLDETGKITSERVLYDATELVGKEDEKGLPDGMVVDPAGRIFATGPGGVWIFTPDGTALGKIRTGEATANCTFGEDGKSLFMTADMYLLRVRVK